jgi:hypothetical protein
MKINEIITEGTFTQLLKKAADWIGSKITSAINHLGFGKSITISLNGMIPNTMNEKKGGTGAAGSSSELFVAYYLSKMLKENNFQIDNDIDAMYSAAQTKSKNDEIVGDALKHVEQTSYELAKTIYQDFVNKSNSDIIITTFNFEFNKSYHSIKVNYSGGDTTSIARDDISIVVTKKDSGSLEREILISLKNYKSSNVGVGNINMMKVLYWLFVDPVAVLPKTLNDSHLIAIAKATGTDISVIQDYKYQLQKLKTAGDAYKKTNGEKPRDQAVLSAWKKSHPESHPHKTFAEIFVTIFNNGKASDNTSLMCRGFKTAMGINNDRTYVAICERLGMPIQIKSSTVSPKFKQVVDALDNLCKVDMATSGSAGAVKIVLTYGSTIINNLSINMRTSSHTAVSTSFGIDV